MLNERQCQTADCLLNFILSKDSRTHQDAYVTELKAKGFQDYKYVLDFLEQELGLIEFEGQHNYFVHLTYKGHKAVKIGIASYIKEIEDNEKLKVTSRKISKFALFSSVITPLLILFIENKINQHNNIDNNSSNRTYFTHSDFIGSQIDSVTIEKIKYSLKHDSLFIEEMKEIIKLNE